MPSNENLNLLDLSDEILIKIFGTFSNPKQLCDVAVVCRKFKRLSEDKYLWKSFVRRDMVHISKISVAKGSNISWKEFYKNEKEKLNSGIPPNTQLKENEEPDPEEKSSCCLSGSNKKSQNMKDKTKEKIRIVYRNTTRPTQLKCVLLGQSSVGKSILALRFCKNVFYEHMEPTIGAAFLVQTMNVGSYKFRLEIWDTAGQERFRSLAPMYYRNADIALVVYGVNDKSSFEDAAQWVSELRKNGNPGVSILLVGNKKDLNRQVTTNDGASLAKKLGVGFVETSAKSGDGVAAAFEKVASDWFERHMGSLDVDLLTDVEEFE